MMRNYINLLETMQYLVNYMACKRTPLIPKAAVGKIFGGTESIIEKRRGLICLQVRPPANKSAPMLHTHPSFFPLSVASCRSNRLTINPMIIQGTDHHLQQPSQRTAMKHDAVLCTCRAIAATFYNGYLFISFSVSYDIT
jgi:hypothetical protein